MTDFIHEQPKDEAAQKKSQDIYSAPADPKTRARRVFVYALALFIVAFLLILWSFLMNDNSNQKVLSGLSDLQSSVEADNALTSRVLRLEDQMEEAEQKIESLTAQNEKSEKIICALDRLRGMQASFASGDTEAAKEAVFELLDVGLVDFLPETPQHTIGGNDVESPRAAYDRMCEALFPQGTDKEYAAWQKKR